MTNKNDGGPAFPQHGCSSNQEVIERMKDQGGMTLRDWFAGMAMSGWLASYDGISTHQARVNDGGNQLAEAAKCSYATADAMLAAREQERV
jgi:hypothetical protein